MIVRTILGVRGYTNQSVYYRGGAPPGESSYIPGHLIQFSHTAGLGGSHLIWPHVAITTYLCYASSVRPLDSPF